MVQTKLIREADEHGTIRYKLNGLYHRTDGPAIVYLDGPHIWCLNGKWHREDGPAYIGANGTHVWYLNDRYYSFDDYCKELRLTDEEIVFLKLKYNICIPV